MSKKKKRGGRGKPFFGCTDERNNISGRPAVLPGIIPKTRFSYEIVTQAAKNEQKRSITDLPGVSLRPKTSLPTTPVISDDNSNDVIDLNRLKQSQSEAMRLHHDYVTKQRRPATKHIVSLSLNKLSNQGFGVSIHYRCKQCKFVSPVFKLFSTTATGACATNVQAAIALSKVAIKSSDATFLFSTLNLNAPSAVSLQKHFSRSCTVAGDLLEDSLSQNRAVVRDYLNIVGRSDNPDCPSASVSLDGQFNKPVYHGYDGKATSVSEPVIENETDLNLLVSHAVVSKWDGSYSQEKVLLVN